MEVENLKIMWDLIMPFWWAAIAFYLTSAYLLYIHDSDNIKKFILNETTILLRSIVMILSGIYILSFFEVFKYIVTK